MEGGFNLCLDDLSATFGNLNSRRGQRRAAAIPGDIEKITSKMRGMRTAGGKGRTGKGATLQVSQRFTPYTPYQKRSWCWEEEETDPRLEPFMSRTVSLHAGGIEYKGTLAAVTKSLKMNPSRALRITDCSTAKNGTTLSARIFLLEDITSLSLLPSSPVIRPIYKASSAIEELDEDGNPLTTLPPLAQTPVHSDSETVDLLALIMGQIKI
eukprot:TRINITY_DN21603_c0_g1_i1.p1 TRINITY_DN21603_c0_g1~~TRINITY_DN21603_c0_g1_i1.p1  ORF type:complete len:222 (+),score=15.03 TRINITY_DN21603_c0_g1_i1:36-668(+)